MSVWLFTEPCWKVRIHAGGLSFQEIWVQWESAQKVSGWARYGVRLCSRALQSLPGRSGKNPPWGLHVISCSFTYLVVKWNILLWPCRLKQIPDTNYIIVFKILHYKTNTRKKSWPMLVPNCRIPLSRRIICIMAYIFCLTTKKELCMCPILVTGNHWIH